MLQGRSMYCRVWMPSLLVLVLVAGCTPESSRAPSAETTRSDVQILEDFCKLFVTVTETGEPEELIRALETSAAELQATGRTQLANIATRLAGSLRDGSGPASGHIYLPKGTGRAKTKGLQNTLKDITGVIRVAYVSEKEAYNEFVEFFRHRPEMTENLSPGDLPPALEVDVERLATFEIVREKVGSHRLVDEIRAPAFRGVLSSVSDQDAKRVTEGCRDVDELRTSKSFN